MIRFGITILPYQFLAFFNHAEDELLPLRTLDIIGQLNKRFRRGASPVKIIAGEYAYCRIQMFFPLELEMELHRRLDEIQKNKYITRCPSVASKNFTKNARMPPPFGREMNGTGIFRKTQRGFAPQSKVKPRPSGRGASLKESWEHSFFFLTLVLAIVYRLQKTINNTNMPMEVLGVTKRVVKYPRDHIITGELAPGEKLNELDLSSHPGISGPPLREAFRILENEYLVVGISRRGSSVTEVSMRDCREVYEAREMIERFAVDLLEAKGIRELPEVDSALEVTADLTMPTSCDPY